MRLRFILIAALSLVILGCSIPFGGGQASVITTSKNFTMNENSKDSFSLVEGSSTVTHTVTVVSVAQYAADIQIDSQQPSVIQVDQTRSVSLDGQTILVTVDSIDSGYVRFSISLPGQGGTTPSGSQNGTSQPGLSQNGATCSLSSDCQSSHCGNGYCCASGLCCISDSNCSIGKCNMTTYNCSTVTLLANGDPCNSNSDCSSNYCNNSHCCNSGVCCLSSSNCPSGQVCNTSASSCVQSAPVYSAAAAEQLASSRPDGILMGRFASIFNAARNCSGANSQYRQCVPYITTKDQQVSPSTFIVTYSYSFSGTSCCPNVAVLTMSVELTTNSTTSQWTTNVFSSSAEASNAADSINSSILSNCVTAVQGIACKT